MAWIWGRTYNPDGSIKSEGIKIPEKHCFKGFKCTPSCSAYDLGNVYYVEEDEPITEILDEEKEYIDMQIYRTKIEDEEIKLGLQNGLKYLYKNKYDIVKIEVSEVAQSYDKKPFYSADFWIKGQDVDDMRKEFENVAYYDGKITICSTIYRWIANKEWEEIKKKEKEESIILFRDHYSKALKDLPNNKLIEELNQFIINILEYKKQSKAEMLIELSNVIEKYRSKNEKI
jgi:hypothetical protein